MMATTPMITHWNPEDEGFWRARGQRVATRNLWLSIPALTLAFAVARRAAVQPRLRYPEGKVLIG